MFPTPRSVDKGRGSILASRYTLILARKKEVHDQIRLGHVGLPEYQIKVLKSIFSLAPKLKESYLLTGSIKLEKADLVLVNVDDSEAIKKWNKIARVNHLATPITLSANGKSIDGIVPLTLPIRLGKLIEALENVVENHTNTNNLDTSSESGEVLDVLIVDDSFPVRKYMEQKLTEIIQVPLRLHITASGEEAMGKFAQQDFDIVFLDVVMEGVDGYKVCKAIKSRYSAYVVMLTSKKSPFDKVRGTMSGCDAYVTKPPADERLAEEIQKCINWRAKVKNKASRTVRAATN
jgi:twitching motility two-component system response regulator PilG